jgi:hypothetical protein
MFSIFSSIWSSEPLWERLEYIAEMIVLIGCVGEFLIDHASALSGSDPPLLARNDPGILN